jgi:hypothetical protein
MPTSRYQWCPGCDSEKLFPHQNVVEGYYHRYRGWCDDCLDQHDWDSLGWMTSRNPFSPYWRGWRDIC